MSKTKIMMPFADAIATIIQRGWMTATDAYNTVKPDPSRKDEPYVHVLEYRSYWLSMSVVSTQKYILGISIFVSGSSKERKNGALKVVDVDIFS